MNILGVIKYMIQKKYSPMSSVVSLPKNINIDDIIGNDDPPFAAAITKEEFCNDNKEILELLKMLEQMAKEYESDPFFVTFVNDK